MKNNYSNEIEDILAKIPNWIIRWGIMIIFYVIIFIIYTSSYISFPDVLRARATIVQYDEKQFKLNLLIPQKIKSKIKQGSPLILKFDSFPYQEFGVYKGNILHIISSKIFGDDYQTFVEVTQLQCEKYNHKIKLEIGLHADCDIIISESSIVKKFLNYIKNK